MRRRAHVTFLALALGAAPLQGQQPVRPTPSPVRVLIDAGHNNFHTSTGGYAAYARLLAQNGFVVSPLGTRVTREALDMTDVFITASALSQPSEMFAREAQAAGQQLEWWAPAAQPAFATDEVVILEDWVRRGGSLLQVLDHAPNAGAGSSLAAAFGVGVSNGITADTAFAGPGPLLALPAHLLYTRGDAGIGEHTVMTGVDSVVTYTGGSLLPPPGATALLRVPLPPSIACGTLS